MEGFKEMMGERWVAFVSRNGGVCRKERGKIKKIGEKEVTDFHPK